MSFFKNLFKKKKVKTRKIEFHQILPFDIFSIPDENYKLIETKDYQDGSRNVIYISSKNQKSTHPWLYDRIVVSHSTDIEFGKMVKLFKDLNGFNFDRIVDYINWISSIYGLDDNGGGEMMKNEKYELEDSINNPDGTWMYRTWLKDETKDPTCMISLSDDFKSLQTTLFFSKNVYNK